MSEYKKFLDKKLDEAFKPMDLNKLKNPKKFLDLSLKDAKLYSGTRELKSMIDNDTKISDIVFWLNMVGSAWNRTQK